MDYLNRHLYGNLATVNSDDPRQPHAATVAYVNDGFNLYFTTSVKTRKFSNLKKNPKAAMTIDEWKNEPNWLELTGIQMEGTIEVVREQEASSVFGIYAEKFPVVKVFPPNHDYRFLKLTPRKIWLLDYAKGFGYREFLEL